MSEPELSPALKARLDALDERVRLQEKGLKILEVEWQEWFDKFRLLYARLAKRISDAAKLDPEPPQSTQDAPGPTIRPPAGYGHPPTPRRPTQRNYGG